MHLVDLAPPYYCEEAVFERFTYSPDNLLSTIRTPDWPKADRVLRLPQINVVGVSSRVSLFLETPPYDSTVPTYGANRTLLGRENVVNIRRNSETTAYSIICRFDIRRLT